MEISEYAEDEQTPRFRRALQKRTSQRKHAFRTPKPWSPELQAFFSSLTKLYDDACVTMPANVGPSEDSVLEFAQVTKIL